MRGGLVLAGTLPAGLQVTPELIDIDHAYNVRGDSRSCCPVSLNRVVFSTNRVVRASVSAGLVARLSALGVLDGCTGWVDQAAPYVELSYVDTVHGTVDVRCGTV